jgi:hypothetical protein
MTEKFTIEDLFIKIIPGGVLIGVLYFIFHDTIELKLDKGLDFFYTFIFFTFSFLAGELIQTIAHEFEWIIFSFFKFYKPSEIFLYKTNPVLKNDFIRKQIIEHLNLDEEEQAYFDKTYKELPLLWWKREKQNKAQSFFWKLYSQISSESEIKVFNRNFLLVRAITFSTLGISMLLYIKDQNDWAITTSVLFILFLWRARGMARTLIFKTVLLNLKK